MTGWFVTLSTDRTDEATQTTDEAPSADLVALLISRLEMAPATDVATAASIRVWQADGMAVYLFDDGSVLATMPFGSKDGYGCLAECFADVESFCQAEPLPVRVSDQAFVADWQKLIASRTADRLAAGDAGPAA